MRQNGTRVWDPSYKKIDFYWWEPRGPRGPEGPQEFFPKWVGSRGRRGPESRTPSSKKKVEKVNEFLLRLAHKLAKFSAWSQAIMIFAEGAIFRKPPSSYFTHWNFERFKARKKSFVKFLKNPTWHQSFHQKWFWQKMLAKNFGSKVV